MLHSLEFEAKAYAMNVGCGYTEGQVKRANQLAEKYCEVNAFLYRNELYLGKEFRETVTKTFEPFFDDALNTLDSGGSKDRLNINETNNLIDCVDLARSEVLNVFEGIVLPSQETTKK